MAAAQSSRLRVIAAVRADDHERCIAGQPPLAELLRERGATIPLAPPDAVALKEMVEGPAARAGLSSTMGWWTSS